MTTSPDSPDFDIAPVSLEEEMRRSYLDYAMSVIVSRALPDVRDGLKPVHRRILYAMKEGGYDSGKPYRKSARIIGDVMGQYHPHGDSAIYDAMVRMAQPFSMRLPLIDSQGNFGSMDGDPPAAMRYTEARLHKAAETLLEDIDKDTVEFQANYDESTHEPVVLPARYPNLLVNGAGGIAVGMATNIPTHNLGEVVDAACAYIDNPDISIDELMEYIQGPDFPTGGIVLGKSGIRAAYHTGHGSVVMRARTHIETLRKDREAIIITEIPYQVNKARLVERMAEVVNNKQVEGISDLRDESDRDGVRVVVELKRDAVADVVLAQLYRYTPLQTTFGVNMLALHDGQPRTLTLKDIIGAFIAFREEVITRRTVYELAKARDRAHLLIGLAVAVANIDDVVAVIRHAPDPQTARERLMERAWEAGEVVPLIELVDEPGKALTADGTYRLSEQQAKAILDLRLHRLTGLERDKISDELKDVTDRIREYLEILANRDKLLDIMRGELVEIRDRFDTPRRTTLEEAEFEADIESLIQREDMVVTVSHGGYVKRVPLSTYRAQRRGGKGRAGMSMKEQDFVSDLFIASTHTPVLFFTSRGMVYTLKVYRLPLGNPQSRGKALVNLLPLAEGETVSTIMAMPEDEETWGDLFAMFATSTGTVRRNRLSDFANIRSNGLIAMKLDDGERLISVQTCTEEDDILLATRTGKCIRFPVPDVRVFSGRTSRGVRGIKLSGDDDVISMSVLRHVDVTPEDRTAYLRHAAMMRRAAGDELAASDEGGDVADASVPASVLSTERLVDLEAREQFVLTCTTRGFGKRSSAYEYRVTNRGGQGIWNMEMNRRNGEVTASFTVQDHDGIMLVTDRGQLIRMGVADVRIAGRKTQGVTLFRIGTDEKVVSVARMGEDTNGTDDEGDDDVAGDAPEADLSGDAAGDVRQTSGEDPGDNGQDDEDPDATGPDGDHDDR